MKNTCCVPHCESRRSNVKLHRFPKAEIGFKWVENINCEKLRHLSSEELSKFFVCHKHFEAKFVTGSLRLRQVAYPTLFTASEINTGIPDMGMENYEYQNVSYIRDYKPVKKTHHEDHSYFKTQPLKSQDYNAPPSVYKHFKMTEQTTVCLHHDKTDNSLITSKDLKKTANDQIDQQLIIPEYQNVSYIRDYKPVKKTHHEDHSYFKTQHLKSQANMPITSKDLEETANDQTNRQPIISDYNVPQTTVCLHHDKTANMPITSKDLEETVNDQTNRQPIIPANMLITSKDLKETANDQTSQQAIVPDFPHCSDEVTRKNCTRKNTTRNKTFSPTYLRITNEFKEPKKQLSIAKRAKTARKFSEKENFERLTKNLKPLAKKMLWMQITQSKKKSKGRRFSDEEKVFALAIMKQSQKSYRFLRRIFILPSTRTINKLINKLKKDS